jgi:hypothetical protein
MKERNDRMEAHLLDPAILVNASTRGHGSWTVALQPGLGESLVAPRSVCLMMPVLQLSVVTLRLRNIFIGIDIIVNKIISAHYRMKDFLKTNGFFLVAMI